MSILEIKNVYKKFGDNHVLKGLDMNIPENSICGFVGKNGAGKTTAMRIILGLMPKDDGEIYICGEKVIYGNGKTNRYIGYLPDVPEFYSYMTAREYLKLCGEITGISSSEIKKRSDELLLLVGLSKNKKRIGGYSRGMKQRLGIAQSLIGNPKLLICDEPTSALDPVGRKDILDILSSLKGKTTVIFSTHILSDVERICDNVGILHDGKIKLSGSLEELRQVQNKKINVEFRDNTDYIKFINNMKINEDFETESDEKTFTVKLSEKSQNNHLVLKSLSEMEIMPFKIETAESSIEELFMEVIK